MKHYKKLLFVILLTALVGCRSITVNKVKQHTTTSFIAPGVIGVQKIKLQNSDFQVTSIPVYKNAIRLGVSSQDFNTTTYKTYLKVSKDNPQQIKYVDSLTTKPRFIQLDILDQVITLSELEQDYNEETMRHLKNQKKASVVTRISIAFTQSIVDEIRDANAVFLINDHYKEYGLSLIRNGKIYKKIALTDATIFGYRVSYFCWGENNENRISIVGIIDEAGTCSKNTKRNARKAKEKNKSLKLKSLLR